MKNYATILLCLIVFATMPTTAFAYANQLESLEKFTREMDSLWQRDLRQDAVNRANLAIKEFEEYPAGRIAANIAHIYALKKYSIVHSITTQANEQLLKAKSTIDSVLWYMVLSDAINFHAIDASFETTGWRILGQTRTQKLYFGSDIPPLQEVPFLDSIIHLVNPDVAEDLELEEYAFVLEWLIGKRPNMENLHLKRLVLESKLVQLLASSEDLNSDRRHQILALFGSAYSDSLKVLPRDSIRFVLQDLDQIDQRAELGLDIAQAYARRIAIVQQYVRDKEQFTPLEAAKLFLERARALDDSLGSTYLYSLAAYIHQAQNQPNYALDLIQEAQLKWGEAASKKYCSSLEQHLLRPGIEATVPTQVLPGEFIPLGLSVCNTGTVFIEMIALHQFEVGTNNNQRNVFLGSRERIRQQVVIESETEIAGVKTLAVLKGLDKGNWRMLCYTNKSKYTDSDSITADIVVANWMVQDAQNNRFVLCDYQTGESLAQRKVAVREHVGVPESGKQEVTDAEGYFSADMRLKLYSCWVEHDGVVQKVTLQREHSRNDRIFSNVYTDNTLYHPGDTVYFCIQALSTDGIEESVRTAIDSIGASIHNLSCKVLVDSTHAQAGLTWGRVLLPKTDVGYVRLSGDGLWHQITIAEYRPPKFDLSHHATIEYVSQDTVRVRINGTLESYSGLPTSGNNIVWNVRVYGFSRAETAFDTVMTSASGKFEIVKELTRLEDHDAYRFWLSGNYTLSFETPYGELLERDGYIWRGSQKQLYVVVTKWVTSEVPTPLVVRLQGEGTMDSSVSVDFRISKLQAPSEYKRSSIVPLYTDNNDSTVEQRYTTSELSTMFPHDDITGNRMVEKWTEEKTIVEAEFQLTDESNHAETLKHLEPGWYSYEVKSTSLNTMQPKRGFFRVLSKKRASNQFHEPMTVVPVQTSCKAGDTAVLDVSSLVDRLVVYQELVFDGKVEERNRFVVRRSDENGVHRILIPIERKYRGGVSIVTHAVHNGRTYFDVTQIHVDWERDNVVELSLNDKTLAPGDTTVLTLRASKPGRVVLRLYDKATHGVLSGQGWGHSRAFQIPTFGTYPQAHIDVIPDQHTFGWGYLSALDRFFAGDLYHGIQIGQRIGVGYVIPIDIRDAAGNGKSVQVDYVEVGEDFTGSTANYNGKYMPSVSVEATETVQIFSGGKRVDRTSTPRKPVDGWSFWYCDSITDSLTIRVPLPDNIATYVVEAVVISPDLSAGRAATEVSVNLPAMVEVQVPRVLRAGDDIAISGTASLLDSAIQNATVSGTVDVVVFDTKSSQPDTLNIALKTRAVGQGESTRLLWNVALPENAVSMEYDISVTDGNRQLDRVQRTQEVEPLLIEVDVRQAFVVGADDSLNFAITSPRKLTDVNTSVVSNGVRVTSQPLVYVARALPELQHIEFRNSVALASQAVAAGLQQKLQEKFPSVIAAAAQAPSRSNILRMFDVSNEHVFNANLNCDSLIEASLDELSSLQKSNGSFSWFHGGDGNAWTTLFVATNLRYMHDELGIDNNELEGMLEDATEYCVEYLRSDSLFSPTAYTSQSREYFVRNNLIHFLAFESEIRSTKHGDRHMQRVLDLLRAKWRELSLEELGIYGALVRNTDATLANEILQLIDSKTTTVDNFGTTWEQTNTWKSRTIFGHNNVLAFLEHVQPNHKNIGPGYSWLLSTMRTTQIHNHAMLFVAKRLFTYYGDVENAPSAYTLRVDDKTVVDGEAPRKHTPAFEDITIDGATVRTTNQIEFTNHANNDMWVDSYRTLITSEVELDARGEHVKVGREITVERLVNGRLTTLPYDSTMTLQASDKIKCDLIITTSIPLSFVHVHNPRPQAFEPLQQISGFKWEHRLRYYEAVKNEGTHMFVTDITPGTYTITDTWQTRFSGTYALPPATIQCEYAPEYNGASVGETVKVNLEE